MLNFNETSNKIEIPQIDLSSIPSIEIDLEFWKTLSPLDRLRFLGYSFFNGKTSTDSTKALNSIVRTMCQLGKSFTKDPSIRGFFNIAENSIDLYNTAKAVSKLVKAKRSYKSTKNDDIAKMMGFPNGTYINEDDMDVTAPMIEAFLEISDAAKKRNKIAIDTIHDDSLDKKKESEDQQQAAALVYSKKVTIVGRYNVEDESPESGFKFGIVVTINCGSEIEDSQMITVSKAKIFYPINGMNMDSDEFIDSLQKVFYEVYVEKVDASKNFIRINGTKFEVCPRINIRENIVNIDINEITTACEKTLNQKRRRGVVLVGEPGTGKTIAVHKIMNNFRDRLVFWVSPDSINTPSGIRNVRKLFKMFEGCIVVFDDLDSAPLTNKNETTNEFLIMLDGTNKMSCFLIATVNDPSKIHMALINRVERFDDIKLVKKPQTNEEVANIIFSKANEYGYTETERYGSKGLITVKRNSKTFNALCKKIIDNGFTQVMIAGLISDIDAYATSAEVSLQTISKAIDNRLESIHCANLIAVKGRLEYSSDKLSAEANASLMINSRNY